MYVDHEALLNGLTSDARMRPFDVWYLCDRCLYEQKVVVDHLVSDIPDNLRAMLRRLVVQFKIFPTKMEEHYTSVIDELNNREGRRIYHSRFSVVMRPVIKQLLHTGRLVLRRINKQRVMTYHWTEYLHCSGCASRWKEACAAIKYFQTGTHPKKFYLDRKTFKEMPLTYWRTGAKLKKGERLEFTE